MRTGLSSRLRALYLKSAFLFLLPVIFISSILTDVIGTGTSVTYKVSGCYEISNEETRIINEKMLVEYSNGTAIIIYHLDSLPYGITDEMLYLSEQERVDRIKEDVKLTSTYETNIFKTWYGIRVFSGSFENEFCKYHLIWHYYDGYLVFAEIEKKKELHVILKISYESSTSNLYVNLDNWSVDSIKFVRFCVSPIGLVIMAIPAITVTIIIVYIYHTKKKISYSRGRQYSRMKR